MKTTEQYFPGKLLIMLYNVDVAESVDEILNKIKLNIKLNHVKISFKYERS